MGKSMGLAGKIMVHFKEHKPLFTCNGGPIFQTIEPEAADNPPQAAEAH